MAAREAMLPGDKVKIVPLKAFAMHKLPSGSILRQLILLERDEIDASEFVVKVGEYLRLLQIETGGRM